MWYTSNNLQLRNKTTSSATERYWSWSLPRLLCGFLDISKQKKMKRINKKTRLELMHICCLFPRVIENICYAWNMNMSLWHELFNLIFLGENNLMLVFGDYRRKFFCHLNFIGLRLSPKFKSIYISSIMRNWSHYNFTMLLNKIFNQ